MTHDKILIIGSGPAGASIARTFAEKNFQVEIFDERSHVAGNCFDQINEHGHLIHQYGPHYFRTNSDELLNWLSKFTEWIPGDYWVKAWVNNKAIPLPISLATMEALKNSKFDKISFEEYLEKHRVKSDKVENAEQQCLALVGKELYELFFKNYTIKQWGYHPQELEAAVTARIPLRFDFDVRYPSEKHQVLPKHGYTSMFQNILNHQNIQLHLNSHLTPAQISKMRKNYRAIFYTGPIDAFFSYCYGKLAYRSLRFEWKHFENLDFYQECVQINFPNDYEFTRCVESKHITKVVGKGTTVCFEYPSDKGEPYYPMPLKLQQEKYQRYYQLAQKEEQNDHPIFFVGRLAEYKYYNMDHIFLRALNLAQDVLKRLS